VPSQGYGGSAPHEVEAENCPFKACTFVRLVIKTSCIPELSLGHQTPS
jgi:hypothetical protein